MKWSKLFAGLALTVGFLSAAEAELNVQAPSFILKNIPFDIDIDQPLSEGIELRILRDSTAGQEAIRLEYRGLETDGGQTRIEQVLVSRLGLQHLEVRTPAGIGEASVWVLPGWISILPPLMAIALALITKQVVLSLFCGIWLGAVFTLGHYNPFVGFLRTVDIYLIRAITDPDHMSIVLFTMTLGGMVGIISRSGGTHGIVQALARRAQSRRRGQLYTWLMGMLIFFDDYSNTLLVGNTMRPFTDNLRISREKLSYVVDSTAAPITSIALISTWIGFELGLLDSSFQNLGISDTAYVIFLEAIPYSFYSIMALLLVLVLALSGRDFGPMLHAERRSLQRGLVLREGAKPLIDQELANLMPPEGAKSHWYNAILPIGAMLVILAVGLYIDGKAALGMGPHALRDVIGAADSFKVLIWAAFGGALMAGLLAMGGRILSMSDTMDAFLVGFKAMIVGIIILTLARSLQIVTGDLHTADYIFYISEGILNPRLLPMITFVISALISFATGTSFGTMAILIPLVIPLAYILPANAALSVGASQAILLGSIGAVLSGAIFGDHCSPISDTTVMSSIASGADHVDHVRTQLPYGLTVAAVTIAVGYIPAGFGIHPLLSNLMALAILLLLVWRWGRDAEKGIESTS